VDAALDSLVVEQSPDALIATHVDGRVALWNPAAQAIFGFTADEARGQRLVELIVPDELREDAAAMAHESHDGEGVRYEALRRRKDGEPIYVNTTTRALRDAQGRVTHLLAQVADVTRFRVQRDSQLVHARFHGVLEYAPDAIVIVNGTGRIVLFNAQARTLFGYDTHAVIGEPIEMLLPARLRGGHVGSRVGYLSAPRMRSMGEGRELYGLRADGVEFPVEISLSPIDTEAGRLVMSAIRDISERRRFERALQEKNVELERANLAKDRFLATMSHELRTPLNAIIGFTGLMLMKLAGPLTVDQEKQLGLVQTSGKHLLSLINDLLDLARIESGHVALQLEPVRCAPVLEEVVQTLRPAAQAKGLDLDLDISEPMLTVRADQRALQQILINLTNNAVKFTARGRVSISARQLDGGDTTQVELAVSDTGIGISAADQARLFQAFTQVGDLGKRRVEGTGLGLHLSHKLAALLEGRIEVSSEPGRGSRFALILQRAP
jgi:PAS domain S-box-containing protein